MSERVETVPGIVPKAEEIAAAEGRKVRPLRVILEAEKVASREYGRVNVLIIRSGWPGVGKLEIPERNTIADRLREFFRDDSVALGKAAIRRKMAEFERNYHH